MRRLDLQIHNQLNADVLINNNVLKILKPQMKTMDAELAIRVCVETIVRQDLLEIFFRERSAFSHQFSEILQLH